MIDRSGAGDVSAEIEQILSGPAGKVAFRALCAAIGRAGNPEALIAYCGRRLATWPDEVREVPWSWFAALNAGYVKPTWSLVRSLSPNSARPTGSARFVFPDPRSHPEIRSVTRFDFGEYSADGLTAFVETLDHWDCPRAIRIGGLYGFEDTQVVRKLAESAAVARLESLDLHLTDRILIPPGSAESIFRPRAGSPWRLRHAGLPASELIYLMRSGLVPGLRSADVQVFTVAEARELAACAGLARLERLAIRFRCGAPGGFPVPGFNSYPGNVIDADDAACEVFFANADLAGLHSLVIAGRESSIARAGLGARGVDAILASGVLRRLSELTIKALPLDDTAIARILQGMDHEHIEKLTLANLFATDTTASVFAAAGSFPRLRHLDVSHNQLSATSAQQLAADVQLPALEYLDLSGRVPLPYNGVPHVEPLGDAGARAWASSFNATRLTHLNLSATGLGAEGLTALMNSSRLPQLATLDLSHNPLCTWRATLSNAPLWSTLRTLDLTECGLGDASIEVLASTPAAPHLRGISLACNNLGSQGARALAAWPVLGQLWELGLYDNVIGDDGLIDLATSRTAQRLLELDLEQEITNSYARADVYDTRMRAEFFVPAAFPSLDAIRLGIIDKYDGLRYTGGIPVYLLQDLRSTLAAWPVLIGFLAHLSHEELWDGYGSEPAPEPEESTYMAEPSRVEQHKDGFLQRASRHMPLPVSVATKQVTDNEPPF